MRGREGLASSQEAAESTQVGEHGPWGDLEGFLLPRLGFFGGDKESRDQGGSQGQITRRRLKLHVIVRNLGT